MQVVLNVKGSFRTTENGHNREVVALYRWPLAYRFHCTVILNPVVSKVRRAHSN